MNKKEDNNKITTDRSKADKMPRSKETVGSKSSFTKVIEGKSVYAEKKKFERNRSKRSAISAKSESQEEFEQRIIDIARVTRVMAGGKRMRFRACVAIGNKSGKVAVGLSKGADVTMAVTKAVNKARKSIIDVPIVNETIPHEIYQKLGAAKVLLKPARRGKGVIAGGAVHIILGLVGIKNATTKILGTHNKVNVAKCTVEALKNLKRVEKKKEMKKEEKGDKIKEQEKKK